MLAPGENPRGAPAFNALLVDPPATEREFIALWKLYFVSLISAILDEYGISGTSAKQIHNHLEQSGLRPRQWSLQAVLKSTIDYVKRILRPESFEAGIKLDPQTQVPIGITSKIIFAEPSKLEADQGFISVDRLLELGNEALKSTNYSLWVLLDRLDVAFSDSPSLEHNALRALFRVYLDILSQTKIRLKIFLRTDIWRRITTSGFREASHIVRYLTIEWNKGSLLNLVIRRALQNQEVMHHYQAIGENVLASAVNQERFFYQVFPEQVEVGPNKSNTYDWMLSRTRDSSGQNAPRELIHLLNSLRNVQVRRLEIGDPEPDNGRLFARMVFKEALKDVSRTRLEQTLYAEHPDARTYIEMLREEKTQQSIKSLSVIWKMPDKKTIEIARNLVEIGFFEQRGTKDDPLFWIPFLYRDALELVQGAAD